MTTAADVDQPAVTDGVLVIDGYATNIRIERRHLRITHGHGRNRQEHRIPRVGHSITRLVLIGRAGTISLEAIRWLHRTGIALIHLDTDGTTYIETSPTSRDDARLRRQQALATTSPVGLDIARTLLTAKLQGQAHVAQEQLSDSLLAGHLNNLARQLDTASTIDECTDIEAAGAADYFDAWRDQVAITWARNDQDTVPDHWRTFNTRRSLLHGGGANRRATDPTNALLNYLYTLAETECRLACQVLGLDPGLGIIHTDRPSRDSLALDLIETIRPDVDRYLLDLLAGHVFTRQDFAEHDDGHVSVLPPLTHHLAQTLPMWRAAVAAQAESIAHAMADAVPGKISKPTPLTETVRRSTARTAAAPRRRRPEKPTGPAQPSAVCPPKRCADCGASVIHPQRAYCPDCWPEHQRQAGLLGSESARRQVSTAAGIATRGRQISRGKQLAQERRAAQLGYPTGYYDQILFPKVEQLPLAAIQQATNRSSTTASRIRRGLTIPPASTWSMLLEHASQLEGV